MRVRKDIGINAATASELIRSKLLLANTIRTISDSTTETVTISGGNVSAEGAISAEELTVSGAIDFDGEIVVEGELELTNGGSILVSAGQGPQGVAGNVTVIDGGNIIMGGTGPTGAPGGIILQDDSFITLENGNISTANGTISGPTGSFVNVVASDTISGPTGSFVNVVVSDTISGPTGSFGGVTIAGGDIDTNGGDIRTGTGTIDTEGGVIDTNGGVIRSGMGIIDSQGGDIQSGGGDINSEGGTILGATGTFTGPISATTGTFSGTVSGATGAFTGPVSGTTGTFSGPVSGPTGIFDNVTVADTVRSTNFYAEDAGDDLRIGAAGNRTIISDGVITSNNDIRSSTGDFVTLGNSPTPPGSFMVGPTGATAKIDGTTGDITTIGNINVGLTGIFSNAQVVGTLVGGDIDADAGSFSGKVSVADISQDALRVGTGNIVDIGNAQVRADGPISAGRAFGGSSQITLGDNVGSGVIRGATAIDPIIGIYADYFRGSIFSAANNIGTIDLSTFTSRIILYTVTSGTPSVTLNDPGPTVQNGESLLICNNESSTDTVTLNDTGTNFALSIIGSINIAAGETVKLVKVASFYYRI